MTQKTLFGDSPPFQRHSPTSKEAAKSISVSLSRLQARVLDLLAGQPQGLTDEQQQHILGMNPSTQRPRRIELLKKGLIRQAGERKTRSGRKAAVWVIV